MPNTEFEKGYEKAQIEGVIAVTAQHTKELKSINDKMQRAKYDRNLQTLGLAVLIIATNPTAINFIIGTLRVVGIALKIS